MKLTKSDIDKNSSFILIRDSATSSVSKKLKSYHQDFRLSRSYQYIISDVSNSNLVIIIRNYYAIFDIRH